MRREGNIFRFSIIFFVVIAVIISLLIGLWISKGNQKSKNDEFAGQMSKLSEDLSETDTVSSIIGKSVNELENEEQQVYEVPIANEEENDSKKEKKSKEIGKSVNNNSKSSKKKNEIKEETEKDNSIQTNNEDKENNSVQANATKEEEKIEMEAPIKGEIIREFAKDSLVFSKTLQEWVTHNGIDIKADKTSVVKSVAKGTVASIKNDPRYGLTVIINHDNGYQTVYSNLLTAEFVVKGESVEKGQSIGTVGNSASFEIEDEYHLHFELLKDGEYLNPTEFMNI